METVTETKNTDDRHKDYENNRAVHAIANINRVYDERLAKHDFLSEMSDAHKEQEV